MTMSGSDVARRMRGGRSEGAGGGAVASSTLSICDTATTARASWSASSGLKAPARIVESCLLLAGRGPLTARGAASARVGAQEGVALDTAASNGGAGDRASRARSQTKPPIAAIKLAAIAQYIAAR